MIEKKTLQKTTEKALKSQMGSQSTFRASGLAFLFASFLLAILYMVLQFYPFGGHSVILSDLSAQYAPDLVAYKHQIFSGGGLTYSFLIGMGKNTAGLFAYYLASPINFVTFLFPDHMISEAIIVLIGIKLSLAAATMTLFLSSFFRTKSKFSIVFGLLYAFSSYVMVYMINIMWLDGLFLLPLLLYFIEQFIEDHAKWWRVTLTLFALFVSGFYIAYMVGIFSFLYLLGRLFADREKTPKNPEAPEAARSTVLRFLGGAGLAVGMSAAVLLPAGMDILGNPDRTGKPVTLDSNFSFIDFLNQFFAGSFDSLNNNKPLIYCGLVVFLLCGLFFLNPYFSRRQKGIVGGVILLFIISFNLSFLNLAWQLFDSPNWFLYRYSFLLVFVFLVIAFASLLHIRDVKPKSFVTVGLVFLAFLFIVQKSGDMADEGTRFYINFFLGFLQLGCLYAMTGVPFHKSIANLKRLVPALLVIIICIEVIMVNPLFMRPKMFGGEAKREPLSSAILQAQPLVQQAKDEEKVIGTPFFRMETDGGIFDAIGPMNAGLYLDYPSISTFNSASNKDLNRLLKQLGFDTNYNYFTSSHSYSSVVADSLLGIKYVISENKQISNYNREATSADAKVYLYKNADALPMMYFVEKDAGSFDFFSLEKDPLHKNPFEFQNALLISLFGEQTFASPVYTQVQASAPVLYNALKFVPRLKTPEEKAIESGSLAKVWDMDRLGEEPVFTIGQYATTYLRASKEGDLSLTYTLDITSKDPLYLSIPAVVRNDEADIYVNGTYIDTLNSSSYTRIVDLGSFAPGDKVEVTIRANSDTYSMLSALFYSCNTALFEKQLSAAVSGQDVQILQVENGRVSAKVTAKENQMLLTTIPYEKGWTLWVDGVKTPVSAYQNALICIPLTPGTHTIKMTFLSPGLISGCVLSGITMLVFAGAVVVTYRKKRGPKNEAVA